MFDIIVPTYNRYKTLPLFFDKIDAIDKSLYTLWIIDDCSPDKQVSVIPKWKNIRFVELPQNIGQAGARNYALEHGTAPYIISLDDDAWFEEGTSLLDIVDAFNKYEDTGCLMFNIATPKTSFKQDLDGLLLPIHVTCGCAYLRTAITQINGFNSIIQAAGEESDVSLKLFKAGWMIRSFYSIHVFHNFDPDERSLEWYLKIRYKETRNSLILAYLYYPFLSLFWALPGKTLSHLIFAVKKKNAVLKTVFMSIKGAIDFVKMVPRIHRFRSPLTLEQFKLWYRLYKSDY